MKLPESSLSLALILGLVDTASAADLGAREIMQRVEDRDRALEQLALPGVAGGVDVVVAVRPRREVGESASHVVAGVAELDNSGRIDGIVALEEVDHLGAHPERILRLVDACAEDAGGFPQILGDRRQLVPGR